MIDTITGYKRLTNTKYDKLKLNNHFKGSIIISGKSNTKTYKFNIKNMVFRVKTDIKKNPISVYFSGSLTKFYFGHNVSHLNLNELKLSIKELSDKLGISLLKSRITRVDYGYNIKVDYPVHEYLLSMFSFPKYESIRYNDSLYFFTQSSNRKVLFYDKIKELKKNKKKNLENYNLINQYRDTNLIRYEISLKRGISNLLRKKNISLFNLTQRSTLRRLQEIWYLNYNKVVKCSISPISNKILHEHNGVIKYLAYHGVNYINYNLLIHEIEKFEDNVINIRSKRSKMKSKVNSFINEIHFNTKEKNHLSELDNKIESYNNAMIFYFDNYKKRKNQSPIFI